MSKSSKSAARLARLEAEQARLEALEERASRQVSRPRRYRPSEWSGLPLPFLVRLAVYLAPEELQRAAEVLMWHHFRRTEVFRDRLRCARRRDAWTSLRPRRHRPYVHSCSQCDRIAPVRKCARRDCQAWVCTFCDPFIAETRDSMTICNDCQNELSGI